MFQGKCTCGENGLELHMSVSHPDSKEGYFEYNRSSIDYIELGKEDAYGPADCEYFIDKFKQNEDVTFYIESPEDSNNYQEEDVHVSLCCDTEIYYIKIQSSNNTTSKCSFPINEKNTKSIIDFINEYDKAYKMIMEKNDIAMTKRMDLFWGKRK